MLPHFLLCYCNYNYSIQFVFENAVSLLNILQRIAVGDEGCGADFAFLNQGEYLGRIAASLEGRVLALRPVCERELLVFYVS